MTAAIPATQLLAPEVIEDPYPFYRRLHAEAPVWPIPGTEVFVVASYKLLVEAAARIEDFSSSLHFLLYCDENGLPARLPFGAGVEMLATADPPIHTLHRKVVFPELVGERMTALEPEAVDVAVRCVRRAVEAGRVDFMAEVGNVVPITLITRLIGFPEDDLEFLLRAAFDSTALVGGRLSMEQLMTLLGRSGETQAWIAERLAATTDHSGNDILCAIARGIDAGDLNPGEAGVILQNLLSAGGESTTSLLGNAVRLLAEDQDLQQRLRHEPELIPAFIEEALRLQSPFRFLLRSVPRDTTLGGVDIPAGATVLLFWGAANRDPAEFDRPDEVVLDRRLPRHHVAFGRGIHFCVGAPLARLEGRTVLGLLLEHTSSITLDPERPPRWADSLQVRRHDQLPISLVRR